MYYQILGLEPVVAFFLLHCILFFLLVTTVGLSRLKKLERIKASLDKINLIILLLYFGFHAFCVCMLIIGVFSNSVSGLFWLIFYLKFFITMGLFMAALLAIASVLAPFGILTVILNATKNVIKS